jgi:hypothetical protein
MRVLVHALAASLALLSASDRGGRADEQGGAIQGRPHQARARGKCGDPDCNGPGSSRCLGDWKTCGEKELYDHNQRGTGSGQWLQAAYQAAGASDKIQRNPEKMPPEKVLAWLLR